MYKEQSSQYQSLHKQSLTSSSNLTIPTLWESTLPPPKHMLSKYRKCSQKGQVTFRIEPSSLFSSLLCTLLPSHKHTTTPTVIPCRCRCDRTPDDGCSLVMRWVEEHYFWKSDRQFGKVYEHYNRKKHPECAEQLQPKVTAIAQSLRLSFDPKQIDMVVNILCNYIKHTVYYAKSDKLVKYSELFIWVGLAVVYHTGLHPHRMAGLGGAVIFWTVDIIMNGFQDVSTEAIRTHTANTHKLLSYYYPKWMNYLGEKGIRMMELVEEWVSEMMMGYMGVDSILFFVDCFMKMGWKYLYKVILSYFEHRTEALARNQAFLQGIITDHDILTFLLGGQNEWPMIFCATVTFNFQDKVPL